MQSASTARLPQQNETQYLLELVLERAIAVFWDREAMTFIACRLEYA